MEDGNVGSISQHAYSTKPAPRQQMPLLSPLLSSAILQISNVLVCMADILQRNNITCVWQPAGDIAEQYPSFISTALMSRKKTLFYSEHSVGNGKLHCSYRNEDIKDFTFLADMSQCCEVVCRH